MGMTHSSVLMLRELRSLPSTLHNNSVPGELSGQVDIAVE